MAFPGNFSVASGSVPPGRTHTPLAFPPAGTLGETANSTSGSIILNNPNVAEFVARHKTKTPNSTVDASVASATPARGASVGPGTVVGGGGGGGGAGGGSVAAGSVASFRHDVPPAVIWQQRMDTVLQLLRSRIVGRGVSREAVVRLGKLEGFDCLWQGNDLTIAGNEVDLEIEFGDASGGDAQKERVKDVRLRYASVDIEDEGEGHDVVMTDQPPNADNNGASKHSSTSATAALVLKRNLIPPSADDNATVQWYPLDAFHANLQCLAAFDRLSKHVPCFPAIDGLYDGAFRRIWEEFLKLEQPASLGKYQQICKSPCGRPGMNTQDRVGLNLQYWVDRATLIDFKEANQRNRCEGEVRTEEPRPEENTATEKKENGGSDIDSSVTTYNATIECEEGFPSLRNSKNWISETEPFSIPGGQDQNDFPDSGTINWLEPDFSLPTTQAASETDNNPTIPTSVRFVAHLHPPVAMPLRVAADMYSRSLEQEFSTSAASVGVWDEFVVPPIPQRAQSQEQQGQKPPGAVFDEPSPRGKPCVKTVPVPNEDEKENTVQHEYSFHAIEQSTGCEVSSLPFSHPRQIVDVIPILRQYAMISDLLKRVFSPSKHDNDGDAPKATPPHKPSEDKIDDEELIKPGFITNVDSLETKLDSIVGGDDELDELFMGDNEAHEANDDMTRKIDVSVHIGETGAPLITLLVKTPNTGESRPVFVIVNAGLNGRPEVLDIQGPWIVEENKASLREDLTRVLDKSEDLGMLVEFIMKEVLS